jgi:hypothetical protein
LVLVLQLGAAMRYLALVALTAVACTQHADGECVWLPGDDGTCSGRGGGGGDPPPQHVRFVLTAFGGDQVFVTRSDAEGATLLAAPLDERGLPTAALAPTRFELRGDLAMWPGPEGVTLATVTSNQGVTGIELALLEDAGLRTILWRGDVVPHEVAAVFDGEAWVVAWSEFSRAENRDRFQLVRVLPDGTVGAAVEPAVIDPDDRSSALALASDGAGGVLLAWGVRIGGERDGAAPLERRAVWLRDGEPVGEPWVYAADDRAADACLADGAALVAIADGFHVLTNRRRCAGAPEPRLVDVLLDPAARTAVESPSPLALPAVPSRWIAGPGGFLTNADGRAWIVDAALTTAVEVPRDPDDYLLVGRATATGYVAGVYVAGDPAPWIEIRALASSPAQRVTIATNYDVVADSACAVGGGTPGAAPVIALLLLLRRRRRGIAARCRIAAG